jgi:hypothetical protein
MEAIVLPPTWDDFPADHFPVQEAGAVSQRHGDNHGIEHHAADMLDTLYRWSSELLTGSGTAAMGA